MKQFDPRYGRDEPTVNDHVGQPYYADQPGAGGYLAPSVDPSPGPRADYAPVSPSPDFAVEELLQHIDPAYVPPSAIAPEGPNPITADAAIAQPHSVSSHHSDNHPVTDAKPQDLQCGPGWLTVRGIGKSYRGRAVVHDVSLALARGEAVGLLGPNGAGKTTVFYMISGLVRPDFGNIELDGQTITDYPMYRRARLGIGYLPQEASIFRGLSVEDNIMAVLEMVEPNKGRRKEELDSLLHEFSITHLRKSAAIALSGGERRRLEIARALASRPAFVLLDEPFAGVDPIAVGDIQLLVHHLKQRGIGVLITDHNVRETLGLIDRAYIIHSGNVLMNGTPDEIVADPDVRRLYLGERFTL